MTLTPIQFAERIMSKYAPSARNRPMVPFLVFLEQSPARWIHVRPDRGKEQYIGMPAALSIGLQLFINHTNLLSDRRIDLHLTNLLVSRSTRTSIPQHMMTVNNRVIRGATRGRNTTSMNGNPPNEHFRHILSKFSPSILSLSNPSFHQTLAHRLHKHIQRNSQQTFLTESFLQAGMLHPTKNGSLTHNVNQNHHIRSQASYSSTYSKSVTMQLANKRTASPDSPPIRQVERREADPVRQPLPTVTAAASAIDMKRLSDEVYQAIERKLKLERQRKGL